jgi:hypothetical protein
MFIPCTQSEYPEIKHLLEGIGYGLWGTQMFDLDIGIVTYADGDYQITSVACKERTAITLDELRAIAKPNDELRLLKDRVGIMERSIMGMESKIDEIQKLLIKE